MYIYDKLYNKIIIMSETADLVDQFRVDYVKFLQYLEPRKSKHTVRAYKHTLYNFLTYVKDQSLTPYARDSVDSFLTHTKETTECSNRTLNRHLYAIRAMFKYSRKIEEIENYESFSYDKIEQKEIPFDELKQLTAFCNDDSEKLLISLLLATGARIGEIGLLIKENIDKVGEYLIITLQTIKKRKTKKTRKVPVKSKWLVETILECTESLNPDEPLFNCTINALQHRVRNIGQRKGYKNLHPHNFRHTYVSESVRRGVPIRIVQKLVGHNSITTTEGYLHVADDEIMSQTAEL